MRVQVARPSVIAHRGVPTWRLEHSAESYRYAFARGADYIEPDVVCSRDGVLVVRHEVEIGETTDVADHPRFADRHRTALVDGKKRTGWFAEDFTWAELQTLRLRERIPDLRPQNRLLDGTARMLRLEEALELVAAENRRRGRHRPPVGVYIETKHPTYHREIGLDLEPRLLDALTEAGIARADQGTPVVLQSMETTLGWFAERTDLPLLQLVSRRGGPYDRLAAGERLRYADMITDQGLAWIAEYAGGIGPHKDLVIARTDDGALAAETGLVKRAHAAGLFVHAWTMRDENSFLPADLRSGDDPADHGDAQAEVARFLAAGVDGVFADDCLTASAARDLWVGGA